MGSEGAESSSHQSKEWVWTSHSLNHLLGMEGHREEVHLPVSQSHGCSLDEVRDPPQAV